LLKINENHLEKVGDLVDVDTNDLKQKKKKKVIGRLVFYFVQIFVFLFSSLLGYFFVLWEHADRTDYPHGVFPRATYGGFFTLYSLHGVNFTSSYLFRKKSKLRYIEMIPVQIVNIIISFISFYLIYGMFFQPEVFVGTPLYGVYRKEMSIKYEKEIRL